MSIDVIFLQEKQQIANQAQIAAQALADFIQAAQKTVHIAAYHFAFKDQSLIDPLVKALTDCVSRNVEVQIAYYYEHKSEPRDSGGVSNPTGTEAFLTGITNGLNIEIRPVHGSHLMHSKYVIRDGHTENAAVWTGSTNFTDGAFKDMENNVVKVAAPELCAYYENDFNELWDNQDIKGSGAGALDSGTIALDGAKITVEFSPGKGKDMDQLIAEQIHLAQSRVKVSSMVLSSETILTELANAAQNAQIAFGGIYDGPETEGALSRATGDTPALFASFKDKLVRKDSRHFNPQAPNADYNYMHNKIVVCDDTVVTGSFNFSHNATMNAENILVIQSKEWADKYSDYIDRLVDIYK